MPLEGYVTRVLLLTDGEPTAGLKDFQSIVRQVADLKARNITVTALGFGPEYNEELMAGIARRAGGNYYYIARPEDIPDVFKKEVEQVLGVTARNVRLTLQLPRGAAVRQVYGSPPTFGPRTAEIVLGDLEKGYNRLETLGNGLGAASHGDIPRGEGRSLLRRCQCRTNADCDNQCHR